MCTYDTQRVTIKGSAKGAQGWFRATDATIYFDHPVHFGAGHALMVDVINPALGPSSRVGLELERAVSQVIGQRDTRVPRWSTARPA